MDLWQAQAPLGWNAEDREPVARTVCWLLSDWSRGVSGEIVHVDGGFHAMGAPLTQGQTSEVDGQKAEGSNGQPSPSREPAS